MESGKVIHSGVLGADAINLGGRLYIDSAARVLGKVRTEDGETTIEPPLRNEAGRSRLARVRLPSRELSPHCCGLLG